MADDNGWWFNDDRVRRFARRRLFIGLTRPQQLTWSVIIVGDFVVDDRGSLSWFVIGG